MRIGFIIQELKNGGGSYQLLQLAQELKKRKHDVYIYTTKDSISSLRPDLTKRITIRTLHPSIRVKDESHGQLIGVILYLWYQMKLITAFIGLAKSDSLDVINPHEWPMHWAGVFLKLRKRIPVVWMCNDVWHITNSENRILFKIVNKTLIQFMDLFLTFFVDEILVLDKRMFFIVSSYYHKKPLVVRSGIDLDKFQNMPTKKTSRKEFKLAQNSFMFLCFSIFFPHRRFEDAIFAFEKILKNVQTKINPSLVIVGSDAYDKSYVEKIKNLVVEMGIQNNVFVRTGYFTEKEKLCLISACDVFVFPNEKQTWGIVVTEAMAAGKPCIVSDEAGIHDIIKNKENGMIFKVRDIDDLYRDMKELFEEEKLRNKLGKNARKYVFENLSWKKYAENMLNIFNKEIKKI